MWMYVCDEASVDPLRLRERLRKCDLNGLGGGEGTIMLLMLGSFAVAVGKSHCATGENLVLEMRGDDGSDNVCFSSRDSVKGMNLSCSVVGSQPAILEETETLRPDVVPSAGPDIDGERSACLAVASRLETVAKCGINGLAVAVVTVDNGRACTEDICRAPDPTGLRGK